MTRNGAEGGVLNPRVTEDTIDALDKEIRLADIRRQNLAIVAERERKAGRVGRRALFLASEMVPGNLG